MLMERNTLMEFVYPRIREYCRERYGIEFQVSRQRQRQRQSTAGNTMASSSRFQFCAWTDIPIFQVVDMRWGVRDEMTNEHMTTELCMRELASCQQLSIGLKREFFV